MSETEDDFHVWTRGRARWLAPNRPKKLNAYTWDMAERLTAEFAAADADDDVSVIVLAGRGGVFSAGIDRSVLAGPVRPTPFDVEGFIKSRTPTIACVDGLAFGMGAMTAMCCDLRVASTRATFTFGFIRLGMTPEWGGSYLVSRQVGIARSLDLHLTGRTVDAQEAYRLGLVDRLVEPEDVEQVTQELADQIATHDLGALQRSKALLWAGVEAASLAEARVLELEQAQTRRPRPDPAR